MHKLHTHAVLWAHGRVYVSLAKHALFQPTRVGALNSLLKVFFFRRTSHGGHFGYSKDRLLARAQKNKLRSITHWLQLRMLWICGRGDNLFMTEKHVNDEQGNIDKNVDEDDIHN
jgi:hypothetical protein